MKKNLKFYAFYLFTTLFCGYLIYVSFIHQFYFGCIMWFVCQLACSLVVYGEQIKNK